MIKVKRHGAWEENQQSLVRAERYARLVEASGDYQCTVRDDFHWHTVFVDRVLVGSPSTCVGSITVYPVGRSVHHQYGSWIDVIRSVA